MPFTVIAYTESEDIATLAQLAAVADQHVTVSGDNITVPDGLAFLAGAYFSGVSITQGRIDSPSLRGLLFPDIEPLARTTGGEPGTPPEFHDWFERPIPLVAGEVVRALAAEDGVGATRRYAFLWLSSGPIAPVAGNIFTVRVTNATTLTADAWTNGALTFDQTLPVGRYQLVGARFQGGGLIAFRMVFPGPNTRPGGLGCDADGDLDHPRFRRGMSGVWGDFRDNAPPTVDFFSNAADSSQVGHLDLIKVG